MAYEMPLVVKEVYLPLEHAFIGDNGGELFGEFADKYKERYGIDLHEIFELGKFDTGEFFYIKLKFPCKIYGVGIIDDEYQQFNNIVQMIPIEFYTHSLTDTAKVLMFITIVSYENNALNDGFGFSLRLGTTAPETIDDLVVGFVEI